MPGFILDFDELHYIENFFKKMLLSGLSLQLFLDFALPKVGTVLLFPHIVTKRVCMNFSSTQLAAPFLTGLCHKKNCKIFTKKILSGLKVIIRTKFVILEEAISGTCPSNFHNMKNDFRPFLGAKSESWLD